MTAKASLKSDEDSAGWRHLVAGLRDQRYEN